MNMEKEERQHLYLKQTSELYAGIGEFVVSFEFLVHSMRNNLEFLMGGGMQDGHRIVRPTLAELTADPLARIYLASMAEAIKQSDLDGPEKEEGHRVLNNVCKQVRELITERNEIVHGTWFIGWAAENDTDFSFGAGFKPTNTKDGTQQRNIGRTRVEFDVLIDRCKRITDLVNRIWGVLTVHSSFTKNFVWEEKNVSLEASMWTFKPRVKAAAGD